MSRGFACIAMHNPKTPDNVGGALRAAHCYQAAQVNIGGVRAAKAYREWVKSATNTTKAQRHMPVFTVANCLDYTPIGAKIIAVDLVEDAIPLPEFKHPRAAMYVFGPEDGTLGGELLARCHQRVMVPTSFCMNLAATVNVVLYDRLLKGGEFNAAFEGVSEEVRAAFYRRRAA